jgi:hypothetical protein
MPLSIIFALTVFNSSISIKAAGDKTLARRVLIPTVRVKVISSMGNATRPVSFELPMTRVGCQPIKSLLRIVLIANIVEFYSIIGSGIGKLWARK